MAFQKALEVTTAQALIEGAHRFARDPNRQLEFTPYPAKWLHQQRWMDGPLPPRKLTPKEVEEAEQTKAKEREILQREQGLVLAKQMEQARNDAVPMPEEVKDLRNRLRYGVAGQKVDI